MTPERWERLEDLLCKALELSPNEREAFVRIECGGDQDLRREVLSLIGAHEGAAESPSPFAAVREVLAALETEYYVGRGLGKYQIEEFLGRGGTSTVYRARDIESGDVVAVKIFAARDCPCESESAVHHPNVVRVLDLGFDSGVRYLVMEYVDGESKPCRTRRRQWASANAASTVLLFRKRL